VRILQRGWCRVSPFARHARRERVIRVARQTRPIVMHQRRLTRSCRLFVLALALLIGTVQAAVDRCAAACEQSHAAASDTVPPCHHASSPIARISAPAAPCGHRHQMPSLSAMGPSPSARPLSSPLTIALSCSPSTVIPANSRAIFCVPAREFWPTHLDASRSAPLRI
jgi:hypothetical protein